jgi:hypothetical protein
MNTREIVEKLIDQMERDLEQNDAPSYLEIQAYAFLVIARRGTM